MDDIDTEVMRAFANFKNGTAVLQLALTQLVGYYERFLDLLKEPPLRRSQPYEDLVDRHLLRSTAQKINKAMTF